jgi:hypothetical protein
VPSKLIETHGDVSSFGDLCCQGLDRFDEELIVFLDDGLRNVICQTGITVRRLQDPGAIEKVILNAADCSYNIGARLFTFPNSSPLFYDPLSPVSFKSRYMPGLQGFIGRRYRHDRKLLYYVDADVCLQALTKDLIMFVDHRVSFLFTFNDNVGGNNMLRHAAVQKQNYDYMVEKWGQRAKSFLMDEAFIKIRRENRKSRKRK